MFSKLCIRKPVTTIMVTLMVFIAGIVSYFNLDQALMPDMDLPIAVVMTTYVGASPEEIEELISKPMEESLGSIANVDTVTSYSSTNSSMVLLQFVDGTDIDMAAVDMRDKIDQMKSTLPDAAGDPMVIKMDINAMPITIGVKAENMDLKSLNDLLEDNVVRAGGAARPAPGAGALQLCAGQYGGAGRGPWRGLLYDEAVQTLRRDGAHPPTGGTAPERRGGARAPLW